ncbi:hypothetical protein BV898_02341 [Hypsibius exemplaris]|uniref:G-protein coupled receptors family 1 profile domain-containing protein n=1 Tax=Hypsibius exemplaris TaxID=2072580 RepID=A0A1W0X859_HYPEX|nr:hypothetical protein BV898_02341 [Hypsibius exemplaris]
MNNSLSWNNSTVITASVCATVNIIDNCTVWTSPRSQWTNLTVLPLLLCTVVAVLNLYNLAVFRLWPQKEPYLLFHIFLAANAVVAAALSYLSPISRILDWTHPNRWTYKVGMGGLVLIQFTAMVNVAFMGIDRWLSVEFAVQYRNYSSRSRFVVIGLMYLFSILHTAIPMIIYRDCFFALLQSTTGIPLVRSELCHLEFNARTFFFADNYTDPRKDLCDCNGGKVTSSSKSSSTIS